MADVDVELAPAIRACADAIGGPRTAHEFGEDGTCLHCRCSDADFPGSGFRLQCIPSQEGAGASD